MRAFVAEAASKGMCRLRLIEEFSYLTLARKPEDQ